MYVRVDSGHFGHSQFYKESPAVKRKEKKIQINKSTTLAQNETLNICGSYSVTKFTFIKMTTVYFIQLFKELYGVIIAHKSTTFEVISISDSVTFND